MKITCTSDLHGYLPELEGGDLLIVAGDLTARDELHQYEQFFNWLLCQKYKTIIYIAGNHDGFIEKGLIIPKTIIDIRYLYDSMTIFNGLKIWGSPWTRTFPGMNPHCKAFTKDTEQELQEKWDMIPLDTDILITHSPAYGIFDRTADNLLVGSVGLLEKFCEVKPKLHVFGHIHEEGGKELVFKRPGHGTENNSLCVNASHVNLRYKPVNKPITVIL